MGVPATDLSLTMVAQTDFVRNEEWSVIATPLGSNDAHEKDGGKRYAVKLSVPLDFM